MAEMKIVHFSTHDTRGGAAKAAYRLHIGLDLAGCNSKMAVAYKTSDNRDIVKIAPKPLNFSNRLHRYIIRQLQSINSLLGRKNEHVPTRFEIDFYKNSRPVGYELFSDIRTAYCYKIIQQLPNPDIIHLHWITQFLDYESFFKEIIKLSKPIVWTLHDMNPFTGGCHYDHSCGKYESGCGACPQLGSDLPHDLSRYIWYQKKHIFTNIPSTQMYFVSPSKWLAECAKKSPLLRRFLITVIPHGINTNDFSPRDRNFSRDVLGIPRNSKVLLFIADSITNRRKGYRFFEELVHKISCNFNICAAILGKNLSPKKASATQYYLGHIEHDRSLSLVYSASDIFVIPSLQDNLPNTVLESLACGTPAIGFKVGGLPEMIKNSVTGLLVEHGNVDELVAAAHKLFIEKELSAEMSQNCREVALREFNLELSCERYTELYQFILNR
jgi:glycosyltransferase involved in cell wall biosynthesis